MAWIKVTDRQPEEEGIYKVKVQQSEIYGDEKFETDFFDGQDWDNYDN